MCLFFGCTNFFNIINFPIDIAGLDIFLYRITVLSTDKTGSKTVLNIMFKSFSNTHDKILKYIKPQAKKIVAVLWRT